MTHRSNVLARIAGAVALVLLAGLSPLAAASKAPKEHKPERIPASAPVADSVTVGLWHFDERGGTHCTDSSPFRNFGTAGPEARLEFGRYKGGRGFVATAQSFVFVPYNPVMESPRGFTVEAWVYLNAYSNYELSGIAMRWTPVPNQQSWLLGVVGEKMPPGTTTTPSPGTFNAEVSGIPSGRLVFAFSPDLAAGTQSFASTSTFPLRRWVHVAASVDGEVVRLFINGRLDVQVAIANGIRRSDAPLVVGNVIDPRRLTDFASDLRQDPNNLPLPWYALNGTVDELRLSNVARQTFESADLR
ncbi:MAG: LamG-like jellyroll fold domain-containing protein [Candidatus Eisenbacteria bacterium]